MDLSCLSNRALVVTGTQRHPIFCNTDLHSLLQGAGTVAKSLRYNSSSNLIFAMNLFGYLPYVFWFVSLRSRAPLEQGTIFLTYINPLL